MKESDDVVEVTVETVEADYCIVDVCEHGFGLISFFWSGREKPFAVAHIGPDAVNAMAMYLVENLKPKGSA